LLAIFAAAAIACRAAFELVQLHLACPAIVKVFKGALQRVLLIFTFGRACVPSATTAHSEHLRQNICATATTATATTFHGIHPSLIIQFFLLGVSKDIVAATEELD
jgi:hypothetical protein